MIIDVTPIFAAYFARNRGPVLGNPELRQAPNYGIDASWDGEMVNLALTFRSGSPYCCYQYGCHLNLTEGRRWDWLRRELSARSMDPPSRLRLRVTVTVEEGALFFDWSRPDSSRRGWYAFAQEIAYQYQVVVTERESGETGVAGPSKDVGLTG